MDTHTHTHTHIISSRLPCCLQLLLRHGANHELKDEDGRSPLEKAKERDDEWHKQVVDILEDPGELERPGVWGGVYCRLTFLFMHLFVSSSPTHPSPPSPTPPIHQRPMPIVEVSQKTVMAPLTAVMGRSRTSPRPTPRRDCCPLSSLARLAAGTQPLFPSPPPPSSSRRQQRKGARMEKRLTSKVSHCVTHVCTHATVYTHTYVRTRTYMQSPT